jgi:hypothetical protein
MKSNRKPYSEEKNGNVIRRTFSNLVESEELVWHRDKEDRIVIPLNENDWLVQFDNELPKKLNVNEEFFIPKNTFHRVIKGSGDLMVEIIETKFDDDLVVYEAIEEGKKKKGKKDACYYKVRARYDVWPSAYGSGSLVKCRKVGAANWGNKTNESEDETIKGIIEKIKSYKIPFKQFNERMKTEWIPMWKIDYDDNLADINENVARHLLYQISNDLVGGVEEVEFKNKSKNPTNHFQMVMYLGDLILWTSPFIYVDDKHNVIAKNTQIKILNSDYDDIAVLKEASIEEKWSEKYKRSIDCNNPKGFSQRAHCQGRKKTNESEEYTKELINLAHSAITRKKGKEYAPDVHELQAWIDAFLAKDEKMNESKKTDFSKEKEQGLHGWFARQGGEGKSQGWVDCNTCRTDEKTGRKKCKPCGRKEGENRKYPACRPTPSACGTPKKGKSWGKKSNENLSISENLSIFEPKNIIKNMLRETFREDDIMIEPTIEPVVKPKVTPETKPSEPNIPSRKNKPFLPMPNVQPDPKAEK